MAASPKTIVMLTADAFGVLPPISRLTPEQAMYHFLSGYTARVAGTEKGLGNEPVATFSTCFGAPFMPRHPSVYAKLLGEKIARTGARCWLVNTGWYRRLLRRWRAHADRPHPGPGARRPGRPPGRRGDDPSSDLWPGRPAAVPEVPAGVLDAKSTWADPAAYEQTARGCCRARFAANFKPFEPYVSDAVKAAGIYAAA